MSGFEGLNPTGLRDLGAAAQTLAGDADGWNTKVSRVIWDHELNDFTGQLLVWCAEVNEEMTLLSNLAFAKADAMNSAADGAIDPDLLADLQASLNDDTGPSAIVGDAAAKQLELVFDDVDTNKDGKLNYEEIHAYAQSGESESGRAAAQYIVDNPILRSRMSDMSYAHARGIETIDNPASADGTISRDGLRSFIEQNRLIADLSNPTVYKELAGANGGKPDVVVFDDIIYVLQNPDEFSAEANAIALRFDAPDGSVVWELWSGADTNAQHGAVQGVQITDDASVSYDDVIALTVNHQVFASDPEGAEAFVNSLSPYSTWTDLSGTSTGVNIKLSSDEGLRALSRSALSGAPTLMDQVTVVSNLPESPGGERNKLITHYYAKLGYEMNLRLNPTQLDPLDVTAEGYSGFNWMMHGVPASYSVGPAIRGEMGVGPKGTSDADRQRAADGNQYIFGQMAFQYASYFESFPIGSTPSAADIEGFFNRDHPMRGKGGPDKLFDSGQRQLRDGFAFYLAATHETDPVLRQQYTLGGTALLGIHEQAGIQEYLDGIGDVKLSEDHIPDPGKDQSFVTDYLVDEFIPGTDLKIDLSEDIPAAGDPRTNRTLDTPFNELNLRPGRLKVGTVSIDFGSGTGDVSLPPLTGWDNPPPNWGREPFPVDPKDWRRLSGPNDMTGGSRSHNWFDPKDRMYTIGTVFQQYHTDPRFVISLETMSDTNAEENDLSYLDGVVD